MSDMQLVLTTISAATSSSPETVTHMVLLAGFGMMLVGIAFLIFGVWKGGAWRYLAFGALAWLVAVAIKLFLAGVVNPPIKSILLSSQEIFDPGHLISYVHGGVLTGLTEVLLIWLLLQRMPPEEASFPNAIAFGAGFGAVEAISLGLLNLAAGANALTAPQSLTARALENIALLNDPVYRAGVITERFSICMCTCAAVCCSSTASRGGR